MRPGLDTLIRRRSRPRARPRPGSDAVAASRTVAAIDAATIDHLLAQVADGDRRAFIALYDQIAHLVYAHARRLCGAEEQCEDAAVRALVAVWREAPCFDAGDDGPAVGWILAVAHRETVSTT